MPEAYEPYRIIKRKEEAPGVVSFALKPKGDLPPFVAGQFVNVTLPGHPEAKSYSLSSAPGEMIITVRAAGPFSKDLVARQEGELLHVSKPLGYFYSEQASMPRLMLAGGIGIAPFMSMLFDAAKHPPMPPTLLLYSSRRVQDIVFRHALDELRETFAKLKVRYFVTREKGERGMKSDRIASEDLERALADLPQSEIFLCGNIGFVRDYWAMLRGMGVPEERLFTEAFF